MAKYKIGDKVVLTKDEHLLGKIYLGSEFAGMVVTICDITRNEHFFKKGIDTLYVHEEQISGLSRIDNWKKVIQNA